MNKNGKKEGSPWILAAVGGIILARALATREYGPIVPGILMIVIAVIMGAARAAARKNAAAAKQTRERLSYQPKQPTVPTSRPIPSMQRRETAAVNRTYPKPDAYCVTCENTGENHFDRDRRRRIAQLDEWLKNGLIDRQEYAVLKRRFQNDQ